MATEPQSFQDAIDDYLLDCRRRGLRPATIDYYQTALQRFARSTGPIDVEGFDRQAVRAYQDASTLSAGSMRGYLRAMRTFSTWLTAEGLVDSDRLMGLRLPHFDQRLVIVPTDEQLVALLATSGPALRILIAVLAGTGMRINDASGLDLRDLRDGELIVRTTKNRSGRVIPLDPVLEAVLACYVRDVRPTADPPDSTALFVTRLHHRLTPGAARQALGDAVRRAELDLNVGPHVLRHWFARDLASRGTTERLLAARMGWASGTLIERYAPVSTAELRADVDRYAPMTRLDESGLIRGLLPIGRRTRGSERSTTRSYNDVAGRSGRLVGRARHS